MEVALLLIKSPVIEDIEELLDIAPPRPTALLPINKASTFPIPFGPWLYSAPPFKSTVLFTNITFLIVSILPS